MTAPILILASRLERHAWTHGALAARLTRALTGRGRDVTLFCDAAEDLDMFDCRVLARRPFEHNQAEQPAAMARWLQRRSAGEAHRDAGPPLTLSLTRLVPAPLWLPLDDSIDALLEDELAARGLVSRFMWFTRHWGVLAARPIERAAAQRDDVVQRVLTFGPSATALAARRWVRLGSRIRDIGFAAMAEPLLPEQEARVRAEVRARLHINPARTVVLVSLMRTVGEDWRAFLEAVARITAPDVRAGNAPVVLAMARDAYAVHDAAVRAGGGCQRALRIVGQTRRVEALLAASDVACAPLVASPDVFSAAATGRFIADAVRAGRPVLAAENASGADLLRGRGVESPGEVVDCTPCAWAEALRKACDQDWRAARSIAARKAALELAFENWITRLEGELSELERTQVGEG